MTPAGGEEFVLPGEVTVNDDLYVGAANAVINGQVNGDLLIGGGSVTISNRVANDLFVAGGNITVNGEVGDDLRVAGGSIAILKNVGDDVVAAGGTIHITKDATINGDLFVAGGVVIIDGQVNGIVHVTGGQVSINGTTKGPVEVKTDDSLKIGAGANIMEQIKYSGPREAEVAEGAMVAKGIEFTKVDRPVRSHEGGEKEFRDKLVGFLSMAFLIQVLMFMIAALVAVLFVKKFSVKLMNAAMKDAGGNMLRGFAFVVVTPIALIILAITVLGIPIAAVVGLSYALMIALAKIFAGVLLGMWIFSLGSKGKAELDWKVAVVGVLAMEVLILIPFVGWLVAFLIFCTTLGAIYSLAAQRIKEAR